MKESKPEWYGRLKKGPFEQTVFDSEMRQGVQERARNRGAKTIQRRLRPWAAAGVMAIVCFSVLVLFPSLTDPFRSSSTSNVGQSGMTEEYVKDHLRIGMAPEEVRRIFGGMYEEGYAARSFPQPHQENPNDLSTWESVNIWRYDYGVREGYRVDRGEDSIGFDEAGMEKGSIGAQLLIVWKDANVERAIYKYRNAQGGLVTTQIGPGVPELPPLPSPTATDVIRAVGESSYGTFELRPIVGTQEKIQPLGAPSCYGLETDLNIQGDYELFFKNKSGGMESVYSANGLEFIQHDDKTVTMRKYDFPDVELFLLIPRYTDCHGLEVYAFGVDKKSGKPSIFPFQTRDQTVPFWTTSPINLPQQADDRLIIEGGRGAGVDGALRYTFKPDLTKHVLLLESQEHIP